MELRIKFAVGCVLVATCHAAFCGESCAIANCKLGDVVTTHASQFEPLAGCKTKELAAYASFSLGLKGLGATEETLVGESALIMKMLRQRAGVASLKEAVAQRSCVLMETPQRVTILEYPKEDNVLRVAKVSPSNGRSDYWTIFMGLDSR
jgi:hypothetical protein